MYTSEGRGLALRHNVTFAEVSVAEAAAELCELLDRAVLRSWRDAASQSASQSASQAARDGHEKTRRAGVWSLLTTILGGGRAPAAGGQGRHGRSSLPPDLGLELSSLHTKELKRSTDNSTNRYFPTAYGII